MQWEISTRAWTSWFLGHRNSKTITTVSRRQTRTPMRPVQGTALVAMVDPGAEINATEQPRVTTRPARHAGHHSVESQPSRRTARMRAAYVRASLCTPVSCPYARGAYAWSVSAGNMRLLCWRLAHPVRV
jgi:hypothetical protein